MSRATSALVGLTAVVSFLLGVVVATTRPSRPTSVLPAPPSAEAVAPLASAPQAVTPPRPVAAPTGLVDFAEVAAGLNRAVVKVDAATRGTEERPRGGQRWRFGDDPSAPREGSGSGFVIDPAGYILTNYHVIEGVDRVTITLGDGRTFRATVVGIDPALDVALLKIAAREPLPAAPLGDSSTLRVGEWVCAIGNPLEYVHSVTVGVVSFLGRKVFDQSLDSLIQTDAGITFGNSGGPLINARGEVVGITTAISAQAANIGFAIPIAQVVSVLPQMKQQGRVARGYIGVGLTNVTPALQRALDLATERGALIHDITPETPAERAGLRLYDVVVAVDGHAMQSDDDLIRYISGRLPGTVAALELLRDGARRTVPVKLSERPVSENAGSLSRQSNPLVRPAAAQQLGPLGLKVKELDAATIARMRLPPSIQGLFVTEVDPAGPARLARLRTGHVLLEINRRRMANEADFRAAIAALRPNEAVAVLIYDQPSDQRILVTILPDPSS
jgi:serine protease Do